jgi:hypothetical protein
VPTVLVSCFTRGQQPHPVRPCRTRSAGGRAASAAASWTPVTTPGSRTRYRVPPGRRVGHAGAGCRGPPRRPLAAAA